MYILFKPIFECICFCDFAWNAFLSTGLLLFRGFLWGLLLFCQPTWVALISLPVVVLEGFGYTLAAVAGTVVGVSWLRPKRLYVGVNVSRIETLKQGLRESLIIYMFVALILFFAAIVETTILILTP